MTTTKESKMTTQERRTIVVMELRNLANGNPSAIVQASANLAALLVPDDEPAADGNTRQQLIDVLYSERDAARADNERLRKVNESLRHALMQVMEISNEELEK